MLRAARLVEVWYSNNRKQMHAHSTVSHKSAFHLAGPHCACSWLTPADPPGFRPEIHEVLGPVPPLLSVSGLSLSLRPTVSLALLSRCVVRGLCRNQPTSLCSRHLDPCSGDSGETEHAMSTLPPWDFPAPGTFRSWLPALLDPGLCCMSPSFLKWEIVGE